MSNPTNCYFTITLKDGTTVSVTAIKHEETATQHVFTFGDGSGSTQTYERSNVQSVVCTGFEPFFTP